MNTCLLSQFFFFSIELIAHVKKLEKQQLENSLATDTHLRNSREFSQRRYLRKPFHCLFISSMSGEKPFSQTFQRKIC